MKNSKGISLIALIITIIVIIILAAIVIGGVFNTPNDAKFANFCQEYDRVQTAVQLKYYELYQKYAIDATMTKVPTHYAIYHEVADKTIDAKTLVSNANYDGDGWVVFNNWKESGNQDGVCEKPTGLNYQWYLRLNDGKMAYGGFEKEEKTMYYTPSASSTADSRPQLTLTTSATAPDGNTLAPSAGTLTPSDALDLAN